MTDNKKKTAASGLFLLFRFVNQSLAVFANDKPLFVEFAFGADRHFHLTAAALVAARQRHYDGVNFLPPQFLVFFHYFRRYFLFQRL